MLKNISKLNLVRVGSYITYSSLKEIGNGLLESFRGIIGEISLSHHESPVVESIDAQLLTLILGEEYYGNTLGITDADLKVDDDEFYNSIIGGKNPKNDVAVVSTKKLAPHNMVSDKEIDLFIDRTTKVALHEVGHSLGDLADEYFYTSDTYTGPERPERNVSILDAAAMANSATKWESRLGDPRDGFDGKVNTYKGAY